jgi:thymidylate synthase ThyX
MTANARNLERILQQASAHPLAEIQEFGRRLFRVVQGVAPSVIKYTDADAYHRLGLPGLRETIRRSAEVPSGPGQGAAMDAPTCRLADPGALPEERILAGLAYEVLGRPLSEDRAWADGLGDAQVRRLVAVLAEHLESYHSLPRAFELAGAAFECVVSASCFAQLKRHRMGTLLVQAYDPRLGVTVPPSLQAVGLEAELREVAARSEEAHRRIRETAPEAAAYILTNAHRRRVLLQLNLREMAHFARLRLDEHAQWDIRDLAGRMTAAVRERMPRLGGLLCGKDAWPEVKKSLVQNS